MNCYDPAPLLFSTIMRYPHIISVLVYFLSIYALIKKHGDHFNTFSRFLLWHTIGSFVFEMYFSFLYLPVSLAPWPMLRCTGWLMYLDVPAMVLTNWELVLCIHTALSVVELLRFRLDATTLVQKRCDPLKYLVYLFRLDMILSIVYLAAGTPFAVQKQQEYKLEAWRTNPSLPDVFMCPNVFYFPPPTDFQYQVLLMFLCSAATTTLAVVLVSVILIPIRIGKMGAYASKKTIEIQKMLFYSVLVQVIIHTSLFLWPVSEFLKDALDPEKAQFIPQFVHILLSYHGTCSTLAMILFTRPVRETILESCCCGKMGKSRKITVLEAETQSRM